MRTKRTGGAASRAASTMFSSPCFGPLLPLCRATLLLDTSAALPLVLADHEALPSLRLAGGSVYDALVGAVAVEHELELVSPDRRALSTYNRLGIRLRLLH